MLATAVSVPSFAMACSGAPGLAGEKTYEDRADVVFTGTAVRVEDPWPGLRISGSTFEHRQWTFVVDAVEKGEAAGRFTVTSAPHEGFCGVEFELGRRYRVIAWDMGRGPEAFLGTGNVAIAPLASRPPVEGTFRAGPPIELMAWTAGGLVLAGAIIAFVLFRRLARYRGVASAT